MDITHMRIRAEDQLAAVLMALPLSKTALEFIQQQQGQEGLVQEQGHQQAEQQQAFYPLLPYQWGWVSLHPCLEQSSNISQPQPW
jgi:hypothetical protein